MKNIFSKRSLCITPLLLITLIFAFVLPVSAGYSADIAAAKLIPIGRTTGIMLYADGAVITGFSEGTSPAGSSGLSVGDVIVSVDGCRVYDNRTLSAAITNGDDREFDIGVIRGGNEKVFTVKADIDENGSYVLGVFLRDTLAGIGTITFIDPESGEYGALGHGISDPDTGLVSIFSKGSLIPSEVISVRKGAEGEPGELLGSFEMSEEQGSIEKNTESGIFGTFKSPDTFSENNVFETAPLSEVSEGKAYIITNISGTDTERFEIEILHVFNDESNMRQMMIKVTDKELLKKTGGIVQGMSGSPIIQNGKLIGAVTHVLVNDPTKGYGIGIESMLAVS